MKIENITSLLNEHKEELSDTFKSFYNKHNFIQAIQAYRNSIGFSNQGECLSDLYNMLDDYQINYKKDQDPEYYQKLIDSYSFDTTEQLEDKLIISLYNIYEDYETPAQYIERIVNRLSFPEDQDWLNDSLRMRILKQFIKYGNYLIEAGYGGHNYIKSQISKKINKTKKQITIKETLDNITEDIFDVLDNAKKEQCRFRGTYGLLKSAHDLAQGNFKSQGSTRRDLFMFAIVYDMSYYSGSYEEILDKDSDIETNLFYNYYTNNLMRYISESYRNNTFSSELKPSGQGINFKNYVEAIYTYIISSNHSSEEKIKIANDMISNLVEKENSINNDLNYNTLFYRKLFENNFGTSTILTTNVLELEEDEFIEFIEENYILSNEKLNQKNKKEIQINKFSVNDDQNSALKNYKNLIEEIKKYSNDEDNIKYGLFFTDIENLENNYLGLKKNNKKKYENFCGILKGVDYFLKNLPEENEIVSDLASKITRTDLIVAFYYLYNLKEIESGKHKSFKEIYNDYNEILGPMLQDSFYQNINPRNIFDILVIASSYAYLNF